ncbi:MAG: hypothetical protein GX359_11355 [Clostridiales bacterium]|nr:hypothetical protein [Clostridiales bacterium]
MERNQSDTCNMKKHISQSELLDFHQDKMNPQEKLHFLEHISSCEFCSTLFVQSMEAELVVAPVDLKENILKATKRPTFTLTKKAKEASNRMQFFLYSLKVGTATIGALIVLLAMSSQKALPNTDSHMEISKGVSVQEDLSVSLTASIRNNMDALSSRIFEWSNTIINTEVYEYDKKEK